MAVTDRSTSSSRRILVPLAIGTTATVAEVLPLMRLLEARLPSLDKTPMTNPKTGCITAPGSACRQGGHRVLDGPLTAAIDALTTRSEPGLMPRLHMLLGSLPAPPAAHSPAATLSGAGDHARLDPAYTRTYPLPAPITDYATTGQLPANRRWRTHPEARQSVLVHARAARPQPGHHPRIYRPRTALASRPCRCLHPIPPQRRQSTRTRLHQGLSLGSHQQPQIPAIPGTRR